MTQIVSQKINLLIEPFKIYFFDVLVEIYGFEYEWNLPFDQVVSSWIIASGLTYYYYIILIL